VYTGLHVKYQLIFSDFKPLNAELNSICHFLVLLGAHLILHVSRIRVNETSTFSTDLRKIFKCERSWKSVNCEPTCFMRKYGKTDVTKLKIDFRNFANAPKKENDKNLTVLRKHKHVFMWWRHYCTLWSIYCIKCEQIYLNLRHRGVLVEENWYWNSSDRKSVRE
jgi:hypothetical protein